MEEAEISHINRIINSETIAKIGYFSLMVNKTIVIPGLRNKILAESLIFAPSNIVSKVVKNMHEQRK
jgi:short-subunit dehydrogenase